MKHLQGYTQFKDGSKILNVEKTTKIVVQGAKGKSTVRALNQCKTERAIDINSRTAKLWEAHDRSEQRKAKRQSERLAKRQR
jgi:predicted ABC-type ATPase